MEDRVDILGVGVDRVDLPGAVALISQHILGNRGTLAHIVTANSEVVMQAVADPEVDEILVAADLVLADGAGVVWASRLLGDPLPGRVAGIDLVWSLLQVCAERGWHPFFLGAAPGVAEKAARCVEQQIPGLSVAGSHHGYLDVDQSEQVLREIAHLKPEVLLVAMGVPRQEKWIAKHRSSLQVPVAIGVGGSLDIWSGRSSRAPYWMRESGLEWAYRLAREPSRLLRMTALPRFAVSVLWEKWSGKAP